MYEIAALLRAVGIRLRSTSVAIRPAYMATKVSPSPDPLIKVALLD